MIKLWSFFHWLCGSFIDAGVGGLKAPEIGPSAVTDPCGGYSADHEPQEEERKESQNDQKSDVMQPLAQCYRDLVERQSDKDTAGQQQDPQCRLFDLVGAEQPIGFQIASKLPAQVLDIAPQM